MTKKFKIIIALFIVFLLSACGNSSIEKEEDIEEAEEASIDSGDSIDDETDVDEMDELEEVEAEVKEVKYYKWLDEAVDEETITVYAEIENTNEIGISVDYVELTYLDSEGSVIAVNEAYVSPTFLNKGNIGYVATEIEDEIERFDDLEEVEINASATPADEIDIIDFKVKDDNLNVESWGQDSTKISVTGFFENESDISFDEEETEAIIGLYDEDDNFLAAEMLYSEQEFSIDANDETSFEIGGGSPLPPEVGEKIDHAEVKAVGDNSMDEDSW